jgi:glycosyltransferase involved in cell wall biosynthesis
MKKPTIVFGMNSVFAVHHLLREILKAVRERGFEAAVIAPGGEDAAAGPMDICPQVEFYPVSMQREIAVWADLRALWQIWRILCSIRPAITNMSTPKMGFLGGLAAWLAGVPQRIYTLRGLRYETTLGWKRLVLMACERTACACAHQVICISRSVMDIALRERLAGRKKLVVLGERVSEGIALPNCPASGPSVEELRRATGIPEGAPVIGFVGRLTKDKGIAELVECFKALQAEPEAPHLLLVGDFEAGDPVDDATAAFIRAHPKIHWTGYVAQPRPYYQLMDIFVFPTHREGLGKVLLEAGAAGKPVVSTCVTGVVDVVQDGFTGILVPPADAKALSSATLKLLQDRELAARMGANARSLVEQHFDNAIYLERLGNVIRSLANTAVEGRPEFAGLTTVNPEQ